MKIYALKHKDSEKLMTFCYFSNEGTDYCDSVSFELNVAHGFGPVWAVFDRKVAENAANHSSEWYNAGYETPRNDYVGMLEVVELHS